MKNFYKNKKILVTGHTGFKGSWLCLWLLMMGAKVYGVSLYHPSSPSHFKVLKIGTQIKSFRIDIKNKRKLMYLFSQIKPEVVFHLAAQPIVKDSYLNPDNTFSTNAIGTFNILECVRMLKNKCTAILITSDKCYENKEIKRGYQENDTLGGSDPYSASKASAEIIISSYFRSFLIDDKNKLIATGRAGNVIGGGDWASNRIIPDCMRSWSTEKPLILRNPNSTRPWQHVLEPLSGYLTLAIKLQTKKMINGEAFNFGPPKNQNKSVMQVVSKLSKQWRFSDWSIKDEKNKVHEAGLLRLNCSKALNRLDWESTLNFSQTINFTNEWYKNFYEGNTNMQEFSRNQIEKYIDTVNSKGKKWVKLI